VIANEARGDDVKPIIRNVGGRSKAIALVKMKLDKVAEPLAVNSAVAVRPRSALGLKYLDVQPGHSAKKFKPGDTIKLSGRPQALEYEDLFSTFNKPTRDNSRTALKGFGDAFAGRGASINEAIAALNPFFLHLTPVMRTLSAPDTELRNFFKNIGRASAEVAPVAKVQAAVFGKMAKTFEAISACPSCLQQTIQKAPPTLQAGIDSFKVQRPFLADFTVVSKDLRPVVDTLHSSLGTINSALETGTPVLRRTVKLNELTGEVFQALDDLARKPATLLALKDLRTTLQVGRPFLEFTAPYQTVCNNAVAFFTGLSGHLSNGVANGTSQNILVRTGSNDQKHGFNNSTAERPADVPANKDPQTYLDPQGDHYQVLHGDPYSPAVDAQGNADCQVGQYGYLNGPFNGPDAFYKPVPINQGESFQDWENRAGGGSHTTTKNDNPGLAGPTYVARRLGINNLKDVP